VAAGAPGKTISDSEACQSTRYHEFDFWLGDWRVFDAASGELVGFDRIEKTMRGCAVQQNLSFLTDLFRNPKFNYRVTGSSISVVDNDQWDMLWFDNYGGVVLVNGGLQSDGSMAFTTVKPSAGRYLRATWTKRSDGSVTNTGYRKQKSTDAWEKYFELVYHRNQ